MPKIYRELRVTFPAQFIPRHETDKVSYQEYLVSRGLPAETRSYSMMKATVITVGLDGPLPPHAEEYLNYLKRQHLIDDWSVTEETLEEDDE
jgi:SOS response regulatory protein OraA/RecX